MSARQQIRFCTSRDGTRIALAKSGSGPPLVRAAHWISHLNLDWDSPLWEPWMSLLGHHHTLVRYDGRGCGLSDREGIEFTFEKCVEDLEAVVDAAGIKRFALFGATAGGMTALAYAARHPERVSHLIVIGCMSVGRKLRKQTREEVEETELELKAIELGWANDNPAFRQFFTSLFIPDATADQARSLNDLMRHSTSPSSAIKRLSIFHDVDLRDIARRIQCPTLVLHSREDGRIPFEQGRALAALIPGARFVPLESRNHWVMADEPAWQQVVAELASFLPDAPNEEQPSALQDLTFRERTVLDLIAQGLDNTQIGEQLGISEKTVRNHLSIVLGKLQVSSRSMAIVRAREAGLGRKPAR